MIHYAADRDQKAKTLCGMHEETVAVTWIRRAVTCPRCADQFDSSLFQLRRFWNRVKKYGRDNLSK